MGNDHVREPFRSILASIVKPVPQPRLITSQHTDRFRVLEAVYEELVAAGVQIDIGQLDWACSEVEDRLRRLDLERQYKYERERRFGSTEIHDSNIDPGGAR